MKQRGSATSFLEIWGQAAVHPQDAPCFLVLYRCGVFKNDMSPYTVRYTSNNNGVYSCKYHGVWWPMSRRSVLGPGVDARLKAIMQSVCTELEAELLALAVMPEHVHLLVEVDPQYGLHRLGRASKAVPRGGSARNIPGSSPGCPRAGPTPTLWRPGVVPPRSQHAIPRAAATGVA